MRRLAIFAGLAVLSTGLALAQTPDPITQPVWENPPNFVDLSGYSGPIILNVNLRCRVADSALTGCVSASPNAPPGLVERAIQAASVARLAAADGAGRPTEGREIIVPIGVPLPVAVDPPPAPPGQTAFLLSPVWLAQPDAADYRRFYPERAHAERVEGRATLDCLVAANGALSCTVTAEDPPGYGFGEASLRIARELRMAPETRDGVATAGGRLRRTFRWRLPEGE